MVDLPCRREDGGFVYLPEEEVEAFLTYQVARQVFTQPWTLRDEPPCDWWTNRILIYMAQEVQAAIYRRNHPNG